jgi:hypothetical protein
MKTSHLISLTCLSYFEDYCLVRDAIPSGRHQSTFRKTSIQRYYVLCCEEVSPSETSVTIDHIMHRFIPPKNSNGCNNRHKNLKRHILVFGTPHAARGKRAVQFSLHTVITAAMLLTEAVSG